MACCFHSCIAVLVLFRDQSQPPRRPARYAEKWMDRCVIRLTAHKRCHVCHGHAEKMRTRAAVAVFLLVDAAVGCVAGSHVCPHHMRQLVPAPYTQRLTPGASGFFAALRPAPHRQPHLALCAEQGYEKAAAGPSSP